MRDLEQELRALAIDWPQTPDLATAVRARTERQRSRRPMRRRLAVVLLVLAGTTMAIEPARSAILEALGLKGARIERREPTATPAPPPPGAALGAGLGLGDPVTLDQARRAIGFAPALPGEGLGKPDAVFEANGHVSLLYRARSGLPRAAETGAGLLISEQLATVSPYIDKAAGAGTRVERLAIGTDPAYRLSGAPHGFAYAPREGDPRMEDQRLAGPTLLVEHDGVLIRIEGRISRARAIAIAESIIAELG
jgi:hypothetical protein